MAAVGPTCVAERGCAADFYADNRNDEGVVYRSDDDEGGEVMF